MELCILRKLGDLPQRYGDWVEPPTPEELEKREEEKLARAKMNIARQTTELIRHSLKYYRFPETPWLEVRQGDKEVFLQLFLNDGIPNRGRCRYVLVQNSQEILQATPLVKYFIELYEASPTLNSLHNIVTHPGSIIVRNNQLKEEGFQGIQETNGILSSMRESLKRTRH